MNAQITVVSGLPRSGTSLMMQMLAAGGVGPLTDRERGADADNPRGYFELEQVKKIKQDAAWLDEARGRAVKVISQLLADLPTGYRYAVVFMHRDLDEILASQAAMLAHRGAPAASDVLQAAFRKHLEQVDAWLARQPHMRTLYVDYAAVVAEPVAEATRVAEFLGGELDIAAMTAAVDPALYRNRASLPR